MLDVKCIKCHKLILIDDPIAIEYGRVYHFQCHFPKGVDYETQNIVGAGVSVHKSASTPNKT